MRPDMYMRSGARGKLLYVFPRQNMVVVSMGETARGSVHVVWAAFKEIPPTRR